MSEPKRFGMCEQCWGDAFLSGDQPVRYRQLLEERKGNPCSPREHAGEWWDEERGCDSRLPAEGTPEPRETPDDPDGWGLRHGRIHKDVGRVRAGKTARTLGGIKAAVDDALDGYCESCSMAPCVCPPPRETPTP